MATKYVLEWSKEQGDTKVQKLDDLLSANRNAYRDNKEPDGYILIAIGTFEEMMNAANAIRSTLSARNSDMAKALIP